MRRLSMLALTALLTGCATATPPTEVTRFHRLDAASSQLPIGEFSISMGGPNLIVPDADWRAARAAVAAELERRGFGEATTDDASSAPYNVVVTIVRERAGRAGGSGVSVGAGGSTGSYGSGVGVGVGVDLTRLINGPAPDTALRLSVRIDQQDGTAIWEGRAITAVRSGAPAAQPGLAAARLAAALFQGFPGRSGETITVP